MRKAVLAVSVIFMASIAAGHTSHSELTGATDLPGSATYGLDRAMEAVSLALTFDRTSKAKKRLAIAEERLAESARLTQRNQTGKAGKALEAYSSQMEKVRRIRNELPEEEKSELSEHINATSEKRNAVLQDVLQRVPEQARKGIETAMDKGPVERPKPPEEPSDSGQTSSTGYTATGQVIPANSR